MSVSYKDYYKILEVERTATTEEIMPGTEWILSSDIKKRIYSD